MSCGALLTHRQHLWWQALATLLSLLELAGISFNSVDGDNALFRVPVLCYNTERRWEQQTCPATRCCRGVCVRQPPLAAAPEQGRLWPWWHLAAATWTSAADCLVANLYLGTHWTHVGVASVLQHEVCSESIGCRPKARGCSLT